MEFKHTSVLAKEVIDGISVKPDGIYADGTLGGGGHASLICEKLTERGLLIGIDRDTEALKASSERLKSYSCGKIFYEGNFDGIKGILRESNIEKIDGGILDLGVSSYQLDNPDRGFSYMQDAPLDMRMAGDIPLDEDTGLTAYRVVNEYSKEDLRNIISEYGEERWAGRIAEFIVRARKDGAIESTDTLTGIIKAAIPAAARRDGPHPSKRTFQAIRIEVNDELGSLKRAVNDWIDVLLPGGRLAIITFHSLEDRIVKEAFRKREDPCECPPGLPECVCGKIADAVRVNKKPIIAGELEIENNPRSRSAKLRIIEKI